MLALNLLTANIHMGFSASRRRFVLPELRQAIRGVSADVVFLQEVMGAHSGHARRHSRWPETPHYEFLADEIWPQFAYGRNAIYPAGHHGNALLSKFPIVRYENRDVSISGHETRGLLHCVLSIPDSDAEVHAICVHLGLREAHRRRQMELMCQVVDMEVPGNAPLIVAGDFNDWRARGHGQLERCGLREAFVETHGRLARTFPARSAIAARGSYLRAQRARVAGIGIVLAALVAPVGPRDACRQRATGGQGRQRRRHPMNAPRSDGPWRAGNRARLLENGEEFFSRAFEVIAGAQREILLETFILFEDKVGLELQQRLVEAARRGVSVDVLVDGYGSPGFSSEYLHDLSAAGVRLRMFDPQPTLLGMRMNVFRRMHRKLLIADGERAFVGGINYSADHLGDFGPASKQDYAIELEGPIVADIHDFVSSAIRANDGGESWNHRSTCLETGVAGDAQALFLVRDNGQHSSTIERQYRAAIHSARREIVIANAYFFPGYAFLRELRHAATRGVRVSLIVQGEPDMPIALSAARMLYGDLIAAGVSIHEYCKRPFHGKVALVDDDWATVGSSNLDPLSLSLNLEANVFILDRGFNRDLRQRLDDLRRRHCRLVEPSTLPKRRFWRTCRPRFSTTCCGDSRRGRDCTGPHAKGRAGRSARGCGGQRRAAGIGHVPPRLPSSPGQRLRAGTVGGRCRGARALCPFRRLARRRQGGF